MYYIPTNQAKKIDFQRVNAITNSKIQGLKYFKQKTTQLLIYLMTPTTLFILCIYIFKNHPLQLQQKIVNPNFDTNFAKNAIKWLYKYFAIWKMIMNYIAL